MKFVSEKSWDETVSLLKGNLGLLATVGGMLVFLPTVAIGLLFPQEPMAGPDGTTADLSILIEMMAAELIDISWLLLLTTIVSGFASLVLMALLRRRAPPTVGQAIAEAVKMFPTYLGTVFLQLAIIFGLAYVLVGLPYHQRASGWMLLGMLILMPIWCYLMIKFSVSVATIVVDGVRNPVEAIRRSWWLTKGNSFRIFFFYLLIGIAAGVIFAILSWIVSLTLSLMPQTAETIGFVLFEGLMNLAGAILGAGLTLAVHAQLKRLREPPSDTITAS